MKGGTPKNQGKEKADYTVLDHVLTLHIVREKMK